MESIIRIINFLGPAQKFGNDDKNLMKCVCVGGGLYTLKCCEFEKQIEYT